MKVGVFTYGMDDRPTGIGRYATELTRALAALDRSVEITLLSPYPASENPWYREFPVHAVPSLAAAPAAATLGNLVLDRAARELGLDVLHDPCGIAPFLAPRSRVRRVVTVHDAIPLVAPEVQPLLTRLIFRTLVPAARRTADAIVTVSASAAADLERALSLPEGTVRVTPLGLTPAARLEPGRAAELRRAAGAEGRYLLYVGNLAPRKNLARVLEAFAQAREGGLDARLVIVGPSAWRAHETLALAAGREDVILTGFVSDEALAALYAGAAALAFPSLYEGFGLPALEAMGAGVPVLSSTVSSLPEVVGDAGLLVDPTDVGAIRDGMRRLLEDAALAERLRAAGLRRARRFTWRATAERTLAVYDEVLARPDRARGAAAATT